MSGLSPFPPSQTKAIWLPSGEKAACVSRPGKLVNGTMFNSGAGDSLAERKNIAQIAAPSANPSAGQTANQIQWLARGLDDREAPSKSIGLRRDSESESE